MNAIAANEPLSAQLRRLHEEATPGPWVYDGIAYLFGPAGQMVADDGSNSGTIEMRGVGACLPLDRNAALITTLRNAADVLADIVAAVERHNGRCPYLQCALCAALAALRERLEARP